MTFERIMTRPGYRLLVVFMLIGLAGTVEYQTEVIQERMDREHAAEVARLKSVLTFKEAQLAEFYARQGSPAAVEMARATAQAKRPRLMAAIAAVESNGSPKAIGKAGERGAWQVMPFFHGDVPADPAGQMMQSEQLLDELLDQHGGNIKRAVKAYNGDGVKADAYSRRVLAMLAEVPR
ncbi:MAG: lytic transglycosylase domain-containing protein [Geobacteraceae bacterium]|nr:lytic transglycosylase domain-containing protein [Geobacteraceae bacterium]NTW81501.1 lytic transglycosylase domain-containing protein [Geobacteraceae bacterium]